MAEKEQILNNTKAQMRKGVLELCNAGLLHYNWQESTSGPPRKYYHLTEMGRDFLGDLMSSWSHLVNAVNQSTQNIANNE